MSSTDSATAGRLFDLTGKHAVITGGGSGIGLAMCRLFSRQGAQLTVLDLDADAAERALAQAGVVGATVRRCNVAEYAEVTAALAGFTEVHILVNNAGIAHVGSLDTTTVEDLDRVYGVNVRGVFNCSKAVLPAMRAAGGGAILNVASVASVVGIPDRVAYSTSKGAVLALTLSTAKDLVGQKIRCNAIAPARVHTPFVDAFLARNYPGQEAEMFAKLAATQPIGRMGTPEEVAALALYLCSDEAAFVTGACFPIDGGFISLNN